MNRYTSFYTSDLPPLLNKMDFNGGTLLDLGCGDGAILYALRIRGVLNQFRVFAVEPDINRLKKAFKFAFINLDTGDMIDRSIDFIICNQVIEHVDNQKEFLKDIDRMIKPNGIIYLSTIFKKRFNFGYYWNVFHERVLDPTHLREYTKDIQLTADLKKYFNIIIQQKTLQWFAITDFILPRLNASMYSYNNPILKLLRKIKLPIVGYYNWELILCLKS